MAMRRANATQLITSEEHAHGNDIASLSIDRIGYRGDVLAALSDAADGPQLTVYVPPIDWTVPAPELFQPEVFTLNATRRRSTLSGRRDNPDPAAHQRRTRVALFVLARAVPVLPLAGAVSAAQHPTGPHRHEERLRGAVPSRPAAGADRRVSRGAPGASAHRAEIGGPGPLAQRAAGALPRPAAREGSVSADCHRGQLQTDRQAAELSLQPQLA